MGSRKGIPNVHEKRRYQQRARKPRRPWDPLKTIGDFKFENNLKLICLYAKQRKGVAAAAKKRLTQNP